VAFWKQAIDPQLPVWLDYRALLDRLDDAEFPSPAVLDALLADRLNTGSGKPLRFVSSERLPAKINYEQHIFESGEVSTRSGVYHDLFNALVWSRYPLLKAAMNAVHCQELAGGQKENRSRRRDALTLFDECGVVIVSTKLHRLEQLAQHQWQQVFCQNPGEWAEAIQVFVVGHALLEKHLQPYKGITAQALLVRAEALPPRKEREATITAIDRVLASALTGETMLTSTHDLSAVPLAGIPGWPQRQLTGEEYYADREVFRPLGTRRPAAAVFSLQLL
jgi:hypothetical protein